MVKKEENKEETRIAWSYYTRDDEYAKKRFLAKDYDVASTTGLGNFDKLFSFLCELDFFSLFNFRPENRKRIMIPLVRLLSTYSLKVICEIASLNQIDTQLFKDRAILEMIGFTGLQLKKGFSKRSKGRHLPFNVSTLGKLIADLSLKEINNLFARQFALLERASFIPSGIFAADSTNLYVSYNSKYENTGVIVKDGKKRRGYKLISLKYVGSLSKRERAKPEIFVASLLVPLNEHESKYLLTLIEEAIKNIGDNKIKMLVIDRGFLSGQIQWEIKHKYGIDFLIYSKSNMDVSSELKKRAEQLKERKKKKLPLDKNSFFEKDKKNTIYGFNDLSWFWTYGDENHQKELKKKLYKKDVHFKTHPIAGALLTRYRNKKNKQITLISSRRFSKKFTLSSAVSFYSRRQDIENRGFRELKQGYNIGKFPGRNFNAVLFHVLFTLILYNFITAYKTEKGGKLSSLGLRRLHREISYFGAILYAYPHFGIFELDKILGWLGYKGKGMRAPPILLFPSILYSKEHSG